jgi:CCR4-NOT transcription complex subunit 1
MPEQIRLKVGGVTPQQMAVYEEFARNIPGFLPLTDRDAAMFIPKSVTVNVLYITVTFVFTCNNKVGNN